MQFASRATTFAFAAMLTCLGAAAARAGDDGAAPLWVGIGSIVGPFVGFSKDPPPPIDYREHGKLVVPPKIELPPPAADSSTAGDWPINQEILRKKAEKDDAKKHIAGQGDARLRYTHPFPNAPVTVRAADQPEPTASVVEEKPTSSSLLGSLNPLSWVGLNKSETKLGPEPDREWLTDPPKGYRAPAATTGQASN